jgi:hypothetical protein
MKNKTKEIIKKIPLGNVASKGILSNLNNRFFPGSKEYW